MKNWFSFAAASMTLRTRLFRGSILIVLAALLLTSCTGTVKEQTNPSAAPAAQPDLDEREKQQPTSSGWDLSPQRNNAGQVTIDMTPLNLGGDIWEFEVALNTHSVNLDFDLTDVGVLRCDRGQEYKPVTWDGSGPGGHHRSGVLQFAALDHPTSSVEIVIRDVARVPERVFKWDVPSSAGASPDSGETRSLAPAVTDSPVQLALSDQQFHFGDVVMSQGVVQQTIDITNTGTGTLRIEKIEPT